MILGVFNEFAHPDVLKGVEALGIRVDVATKPNPLVKTPEEAAVVRTNAKLIFDPRTPEDVLRANVESLVKLGFVVTHHKPKTSAGCPMNDRVIFTFPE